MDPNANLKEQLELASRLVEAIENERRINTDDPLRLAELVIALDGWMSKGGFLPEAWDKGR